MARNQSRNGAARDVFSRTSRASMSPATVRFAKRDDNRAARREARRLVDHDAASCWA